MSSVRNVAERGRPMTGPVIASISSIVQAPPASCSRIRVTPNMPMRLPMKFGVSFATTTPLPSAWSPNCTMPSTTARSVSAVGMISSSGRYRGGLKKWVPSQWRRKASPRPSARLAIGMPDVLELTTACAAR